MSQKRTIELTCPMCGKPAPFTLWDSVNNVLNPELEEQLLKNTFALFSCPHCGGQNYVAYDFLYHDMQKGVDDISSAFPGRKGQGEGECFA